MTARPLVSADDVRAARKRRETRLDVPAGAIVTPLARDEAARWGIDLVEGIAAEPRPTAPADAPSTRTRPHVPTCDAPSDDVDRVVARVLARVPGADPAQVREIARRVLERSDG